ncbi:sulfotransferase family 2 domain-containing protein [Roseovarius sp. SYSU LYC5161]|uniref:sulfotransferase family 2 domain-containing protein n=1 Tax=Roseovarius halophilus (ex Wu et al. 2025) TaxID=3376060 RepID=UPI00399AD3AC
MGWRGYIHEDSETVFFWSQKAACTTLFGFLADNMAERPPRKKYFHTHSKPYQHCMAAIRDRGYRAVILARHPVTRIISAYFNKFCVYRGERLLSRADLEPFARDLHDLYCARQGIAAEDNVISFEAFLDTVARMHADRPRPRLPINGHWETQVPPFHARLGLRYDRVVHVENLDAEMGALADELGMVYSPKAMNRTELPPAPTAAYLGQVPAREVSGMDFGYDNFITPRTLARIHAIYAVDFEVLGYPAPEHVEAPRTGLARSWQKIRHYSARITGK